MNGENGCHFAYLAGEADRDKEYARRAGQMQEQMKTVPGIMRGEGYKLLRSEYRLDARSHGALDSAADWLVSIELLLNTGSTPHPAVHDLYYNGDVLVEDLLLFARVLTRYVHWHEIEKESY